MDKTEIKPCPFCGSTNLEISKKTATGALVDGRIHRVAVYCKDCNTYGPRATIRDPEDSWRFKTTELEQEAIKKWNERKG